MAHQTRGTDKSDVFHAISFSITVLGLLMAGVALQQKIVHERPRCTGPGALWLTLMASAPL